MSAEVSMVTLQEAVWFLQKVLSISSPLDKLRSNPKAFLQEFLTEWVHQIPYQTIKAISVPQEQRHRPTFPEIKKDVFAKLGGNCHDHNVFCCELLHTLGYDVYLAKGDLSFLPAGHPVVMVQNLTGEGSIHMVDAGMGYPTFRAIPFDFDDVSPAYCDSYLRYRFVRKGDVIIRQHHADTDTSGALFSDKDEDGWYSIVHIDFSRQKNASFFHDVEDSIYTNPYTPNSLLTKPLCMAWPNGGFVCIKKTTLFVEIKEGCLQKSYFQSQEEILDAFDCYFPQFSRKMVKAALNDVHVKLDFNKCSALLW